MSAMGDVTPTIGGIIIPTVMPEHSAEDDLCRAIVLLEQGHREDGLQALSSILVNYGDWLRTADGRTVYEAVQVQRAFSLMHLQKNVEAKPLLEEATRFELDGDVRSDVHCHLGRCYHELALYTLAREQFEQSNALGVSEKWEAAFHYYYGYTLYELKEFQQAKREFILCLQSSLGQNSPCDIQCLQQQVANWVNAPKPHHSRNVQGRSNDSCR